MGRWNIPEIIKQFRRLKEAGKKPEISYGWFEHMIRVTCMNRAHTPHCHSSKCEVAKATRPEHAPESLSDTKWVPAALLYPVNGECPELLASGDGQNSLVGDAQVLAQGFPHSEEDSGSKRLPAQQSGRSRHISGGLRSSGEILTTMNSVSFVDDSAIASLRVALYGTLMERTRQ
jgi:hypothetical protein